MIRIFTVVYGEKFCDMFARIALRSLTQPLNSMVAEAARWSIYTQPEYGDWLRARVPNSDITTFSAQDLDTGDMVSSSSAGTAISQGCLLHEIKTCLQKQATMIMAPPDTFWGDGSLNNLVAVAGEQNNNCVVAPHPRVNREAFLAALPAGPIGNPELVKLALAHLHRTWLEADTARDTTNSFYSGVTIRALPAPKHYAVAHRMPTCYLARFTPGDLDFIARQNQGAWDHHWPALLVQQERHRFIGSSDGFFAAELTAEDTLVPPAVKPAGAPDLFHRSDINHQVNRNFVSIWRAA